MKKFNPDKASAKSSRRAVSKDDDDDDLSHIPMSALMEPELDAQEILVPAEDAKNLVETMQAEYLPKEYLVKDGKPSPDLEDIPSEVSPPIVENLENEEGPQQIIEDPPQNEEEPPKNEKDPLKNEGEPPQNEEELPNLDAGPTDPPENSHPSVEMDQPLYSSRSLSVQDKSSQTQNVPSRKESVSKSTSNTSVNYVDNRPSLFSFVTSRKSMLDFMIERDNLCDQIGCSSEPGGCSETDTVTEQEQLPSPEEDELEAAYNVISTTIGNALQNLTGLATHLVSVDDLGPYIPYEDLSPYFSLERSRSEGKKLNLTLKEINTVGPSTSFGQQLHNAVGGPSSSTTTTTRRARSVPKVRWNEVVNAVGFEDMDLKQEVDPGFKMLAHTSKTPVQTSIKFNEPLIGELPEDLIKASINAVTVPDHELTSTTNIFDRSSTDRDAARKSHVPIVSGQTFMSFPGLDLDDSSATSVKETSVPATTYESNYHLDTDLSEVSLQKELNNMGEQIKAVNQKNDYDFGVPKDALNADPSSSKNTGFLNERPKTPVKLNLLYGVQNLDLPDGKMEVMPAESNQTPVDSKGGPPSSSTSIRIGKDDKPTFTTKMEIQLQEHLSNIDSGVPKEALDEDGSQGAPPSSSTSVKIGKDGKPIFTTKLDIQLQEPLSGIEATSSKPSDSQVAASSSKPSDSKVPVKSSEPTIGARSSKPSKPNTGARSSKPSKPNIGPRSSKPGEPNIGARSSKPSEPIEPRSSKPSEPTIEATSSRPSDSKVPPTSSESNIGAPSGKPSEPNIESGYSKPSEPNIESSSTKPSEPNIEASSSKPSDSNAAGSSSKPSDSKIPAASSEPNIAATSSKPSDSKVAATSNKPNQSNEIASTNRPVVQSVLVDTNDLNSPSFSEFVISYESEEIPLQEWLKANSDHLSSSQQRYEDPELLFKCVLTEIDDKNGGEPIRILNVDGRTIAITKEESDNIVRPQLEQLQLSEEVARDVVNTLQKLADGGGQTDGRVKKASQMKSQIPVPISSRASRRSNRATSKSSKKRVSDESSSSKNGKK